MKIALVTGSGGFIGRHFVAELRRRDWRVDGCDVVDGIDALDLFRECDRSYDLVVHAAASSPHRSAIDRQPGHMARNLHLDAAMFDWATRTQQRRVLYFSSSAAYPTDLQTPFHRVSQHEDNIRHDYCWEPDATYGWVKLTGERLAIQARRAGAAVTVVRPFSGYGEDQSEDFPFRALAERARRRQDPFTIWGDGEQVRDWIHIDDVVSGALAVAGSGTAEPVNLCTGVGVSMLEVAKLACTQVGYQPEFEFRLDQPAGVAHRVGNPARLHRFYKPQISLQEGIRRALEG